MRLSLDRSAQPILSQSVERLLPCTRPSFLTRPCFTRSLSSREIFLFVSTQDFLDRFLLAVSASVISVVEIWPVKQSKKLSSRTGSSKYSKTPETLGKPTGFTNPIDVYVSNNSSKYVCSETRRAFSSSTQVEPILFATGSPESLIGQLFLPLRFGSRFEARRGFCQLGFGSALEAIEERLCFAKGTSQSL